MNNASVRRFRSLDALRGLAALVVVVHHLVMTLPDGVRSGLRYIDLPLEMGGRSAVMLFFVLSGFVLALPYFAGTHLAYGPYLVRRFCRLYPPFAFAVLVSALLCYLLGGPSVPIISGPITDAWSKPVTWGVVVSHLLVTGVDWDRTVRLDGPIWSLLVEMRVSLIFPLLVLYIRRFGWLGVTVALVAAFVCAKTGAALGELSPYAADSFAGVLLLTGRYIVLFLLGAIMAARLDWFKSMLLRVSLTLHVALFIGMASVWLMLAYTEWEYLHVGYSDVFCSVFTMYLIGLCVTFPKVSSTLSGRVFLWLGDISFSLYLIHLPVLMAVFILLYGRASFGVTIALALPLVLLAGHVMHYLIERPSMILGRKLATRY